MEYRQLGRTGTRVSELCLGTMTFGNEADEATSQAIVDRFVDAGGNFIDTANVYSQGVSEEITGRAIKDKRDQIVLATKARFAMGNDTNAVGSSRRNLRAACEASLRRLGTEWIDLYQVHMWDKHTPLEETLSTLDDLVREGKVRYIGASNFAGWHLAKALGVSALHNWEPFVCLQPEYSLITRDAERELLPLCMSEGLAVIPWSPLGGGILTGKYARDVEFPAGTRGADTENPITFTYRLDDRAWNIVDAVKDAAAKTGKSAAQISLNWVLHRRGVTAPIIGARNLTQLEDNLGAVGWTLDDETGKALGWASAFRLGYPYEFIQYAELMELRQLGRTGTRVTEVCLGAMTFGRETSEEESGEILARYLDAGGNFVDTANTYNRGASEEILGRLLQGRRDAIVLATKCRMPMGSGPNDKGASRRVIREQVEASLGRLQTDWIDLFQIHCWDATTPLTETVSTLDDLVREGKVRYVGASNYTGWQLATALGVARARLGAVRVAPTAVFARVSRHRARAAAARRVRGPGGAAVESARRRAALGQVPPG